MTPPSLVGRRRVVSGALLPLVCVFLLLAFVPAPQVSAALTYAFTSTTGICFVEQVSTDDFSITGVYEWFENPNKKLAVHILLYDPDSNMVSSETLKQGRGSFVLKLGRRMTGMYRVCAEVVSPNFDPTAKPPLLISFDIDQTKGGMDTAKAAREAAERETAVREEVDGLTLFTFRDAGGQAKTVLQPREKLQELATSLNELGYAMSNVENGINLNLNREGRMRMTSEDTFSRVWTLAAVTIAITGIVVYVQFRMLKDTIVKKKLI